MVTLEELKAHLRMDHDHEDTLILTYQDAAEQAVRDYTGVDFDDPAPGPVRAAVLLMVADLYENREGGYVGARRSDSPVVRMLLNPYREIDLS